MVSTNKIVPTSQVQPVNKEQANSVDYSNELATAHFEQLYKRYIRAGYELLAINKQANRKPRYRNLFSN